MRLVLTTFRDPGVMAGPRLAEELTVPGTRDPRSAANPVRNSTERNSTDVALTEPVAVALAPVDPGPIDPGLIDPGPGKATTHERKTAITDSTRTRSDRHDTPFREPFSAAPETGAAAKRGPAVQTGEGATPSLRFSQPQPADNEQPHLADRSEDTMRRLRTPFDTDPLDAKNQRRRAPRKRRDYCASSTT
jgi:hypothetical protein